MGKLVLSIVYLLFANMGSAVAHPQKAAISDVLVNGRSGFVEFAHRFSLHDAEHALRLRNTGHIDLIYDTKVQAEFAGYVMSHFKLRHSETGSEIVLDFVGVEIEGGYIWVYQQLPLIDLVSPVTVSFSALQEAWPEQVNTVNIRRNREVETLVFETGDRGLDSLLLIAKTQ